MEGLKQLLSRKSRFLPKTQAQALAALGEGIVDEAVFVWKAVNVHPVFEEPWDFNEIDRLLAKKDLDLETTLLLMTIFERLIRDPDKEAALFAAESINALERRFAGRVRQLRAETTERPGPEGLLRLASAYRDFGLACFARPVLKRYYLRESLAVLTEMGEAGGGLPEAAALEISVLLELGEAEEAAGRIRSALAAHPANPALVFLAARARYESRDYRGVVRLLEAASGLKATPDLAAARDFWTRGACRD